MNFQDRLSAYQQRIERYLDSVLPSPDEKPERLHEAMRYSSLDAGKRIRPSLVYLTGEALGADLADLDGPACAVELIHTYSLIHDDLPAMDDDELRRGKPTSHVAFDEATAILAGDALHTLAFEVLATAPMSDWAALNRVQMIEQLAKASGSKGMGGGQAIDLEATGRSLSEQELVEMHNMKTGCLICCSITLGALATPSMSLDVLQNVQKYGAAIGLAFQIRDDILDVEADTAVLGKPQGSDAINGKVTFPSVLGMDNAKAMAKALVNEGINALENVPGNTDDLKQFAEFLIVRNH